MDFSRDVGPCRESRDAQSLPQSSPSISHLHPLLHPTPIKMGCHRYFISFFLSLSFFPSLYVYLHIFLFLGDFLGRVYGFTNYGTLYGLLSCLSGAVNLLQYVLEIAVTSWGKGNYLYVNLFLTAVEGVLVIFPLLLLKKLKK